MSVAAHLTTGDRPPVGSVPGVLAAFAGIEFNQIDPVASGLGSRRPNRWHTTRARRGPTVALPIRRSPSDIVCRPGVPGCRSAICSPSPLGTKRRRRKAAVHPGRRKVIVNCLWHATVRRTCAYPCGAMRVLVGTLCRRQPSNHHLLPVTTCVRSGIGARAGPGFPVLSILPILPCRSGRRSWVVPGCGRRSAGQRAERRVPMRFLRTPGRRAGHAVPRANRSGCPSGPGCDRPVGSRSVSSGVGSSHSPCRALPWIPLLAPRRGSRKRGVFGSALAWSA